MSEIASSQSEATPEELRTQLQHEWVIISFMRYQAVDPEGHLRAEGVDDYMAALVAFQMNFYNALPKLVMAEPVNRMLLPDTIITPGEFYCVEGLGPIMKYGVQSEGLGKIAPFFSDRTYRLFK